VFIVGTACEFNGITIIKLLYNNFFEKSTSNRTKHGHSVNEGILFLLLNWIIRINYDFIRVYWSVNMAVYSQTLHKVLKTFIHFVIH
jgi:hypothetical protein